MTLVKTQFSKTAAIPASGDPLKATIALLTSNRDDFYYAYERGNTWYVGLRNYASLVVDADGKRATKTDKNGEQESRAVEGSLNDEARAFTSEYSADGKIFGQVAFNYSAHMSGQTYNPGQWPILSLMVPWVQAVISPDSVTVKGFIEEEVKAAFDLIQTSLTGANAVSVSDSFLPVDLQVNSDDYKSRVSRSIADIKQGKYTKAIPSRMVNLPGRVDMLATLYHGRRANTPARSFTLNHAGMQATGFSPEVLLSIDGDVAFTEALAGTQLSDGADIDPARNKLLNDPKEVNEHVIAIKGSIRRLNQFCSPETIAVKDFMSIMLRGNLNHLFSHVTGKILPNKDGWDALPGLVANITVPGLPKQGNMEAIQAFEPYPRDLYCGAVLMLDEGAKFFEATLVLRTVFQDEHRQWLQAGAGVTGLSNPEREFMETCEKLGSVSPHVVAETRASSENLDVK
ncbi:Salicylate synthase [Cladobotryum mycophilum]|uniref:Salicylate synthase n=1 Tax=Cladobotryum mycophilum TaxID=491253 RepID=A0ABR0SBA2_9HYPO